MDHRKQQQQQRSGGSAASSGKNGSGGKGSGKAGGGGSGGKKPIKVVYISNPMRVKTNAAGFRALVQELTGRHADPSKYSADDDAQQQLSPEGSAAASTTPDAAAAPGPAAAPDFAAPAFDGDEDEDDIFRSQLLDNDYPYPVFSPSTVYDYPHGSNKV